MNRNERDKDQQNTNLSPKFPCPDCHSDIFTLAVGNEVWAVQEILPPIYCTDAHGNIIGVNLNHMPFYIFHYEFCKPPLSTAELLHQIETRSQITNQQLGSRKR